MEGGTTKHHQSGPSAHRSQELGVLDVYEAPQPPADTLVAIPLTIQLPNRIPTGKGWGKAGRID